MSLHLELFFFFGNSIHTTNCPYWSLLQDSKRISHCVGRMPFVRDITSLKDMNEARQGGWELMGEQLVKEKKLGLEILPLNSCQACFSIKSSKHDIFINLL